MLDALDAPRLSSTALSFCMKQCTYCGKKYPDDATTCAIDAEPLAQVGPQTAPSRGEDEATPRRFSPNDAVRAAANKNMLAGGLWCVGGIIVTAVTYGAASSRAGGGSYVVAWGPLSLARCSFFEVSWLLAELANNSTDRISRQKILLRLSRSQLLQSSGPVHVWGEARAAVHDVLEVRKPSK